MKRWRFGGLWRPLALFALLATACAPAVPDLSAAAGSSAAAAVVTTTSAPTTTLAATTTSTTSVTTTAPTTTTTTTTTTTLDIAGPAPVTVGAWTATPQNRDESGEQFVATLTVPVLTADVESALRGRVATLVDGHLESQVGATLALWRSIEGQGERDMTGSVLSVVFEIGGFEDGFISLRFFSDEQVAGSGGAKREVTTLMVDLESGVAIGLDDIIFSGDSRVALLALVTDGLRNGYFEGDEESFGLWAGNLSTNDLDRAVLTPDGLEVWFDELEVGPPDIGMPVVAIPYTELGDILDPLGPASIFAAAP